MPGLSLSRSRQAPAEDSPAFGGIAERFRRGGDLDRAIGLCREGLEKFPNQLSARVTLGWALLDKGDYAQARAELEKVLRRAPDNLAAIRGLAELHERAEMSMPAMDEDSQWTPPLDEPAIEELPPAQVVPHVSSEADLAVPVDAQGNPLMVSAPPVTEPEPRPSIAASEVELLPPAVAAMAATQISESEPLPAMAISFEPLISQEDLAEAPALLSADEATDDLAALAALTFEVDANAEAAVEPALFSVASDPAAADQMVLAGPDEMDLDDSSMDLDASALDPFIEAEPLVASIETAEWSGFDTAAALSDVAAGVGEAGVTDLVLDLPAGSTELELTRAFAALEAASPVDGLDDEPVIDLVSAQAETPDFAETEEDWAPVPIAQLDFVTPVPVAEALVAGLNEEPVVAAAVTPEVVPEPAVAAIEPPVVLALDAPDGLHEIDEIDGLDEPAGQPVESPVVLAIAPAVFAVAPEAAAVALELAPEPEVSPSLVTAVDEADSAAAPTVAAVEHTRSVDQDDVTPEIIERERDDLIAERAVLATDPEPSTSEVAATAPDVEVAGERTDQAVADDLHTEIDIDDALPIAAFSDVAASAVAELVAPTPAPMAGLSLAAFAASSPSSLFVGPTINGHTVSRRSALPALERLLRQVEARRLQLASGSPA